MPPGVLDEDIRLLLDDERLSIKQRIAAVVMFPLVRMDLQPLANW